LSFDVAIIGCGPVGGVAANLLGALGLRTAVIEARATPYPLPRAVHLDHEIMRVLQGAGLAEPMGAVMRAAQGHVHLGADGDVIRYLGHAGGDATPRPHGWASDYFFYQPELETLLRDGLTRFPRVETIAGTVTALEQDDGGVRLSVEGDGGHREVSAAYAIACDGASSATRKALGIALDDLGFDEPWLVVDAEVAGPLRFPPIPGLPLGADLQQLSVMVCDPRRPATVVPGRGNHRRWEFMLLPGETEEQMRDPAVAAALIAPWVAGLEHRIVRAATYRFHALVADRWQAGRVFLAGDAAHQTPPFFGQGMCHGVRDVANLAWKLALVVDGRARTALLDGYQAEREPQVRAVIAAAIAAGRYICERDPVAAAARDRGLRAAGADRAGRTAAELVTPLAAGVRIGDARAGERFVQPRVRTAGGTTMLLDDAVGAGAILLTRGVMRLPESSRWRFDALEGRIVTIGDGGLIDQDGGLGAWFDAGGVDAVLLRPDRYVFGTAHAGGEAALVEDWVDAIAGTNDAPPPPARAPILAGEVLA
jgi:3-(3-hydroxy-phenyl)propionate hydroxylase